MSDAGPATSSGEARRLVKQGAVKLIDEKKNNANMQVEPVGKLILQSGKQRFAKIVLT